MRLIFIAGEIISADEAEACCGRYEEQGIKHMYFLQTRCVCAAAWVYYVMPNHTCNSLIVYAASLKYEKKLAYSDMFWCSKQVVFLCCLYVQKHRTSSHSGVGL